MIKIYLNSVKIFYGDLGRSLTDIDDVILHINEKFGKDNWTSFEYIKVAAES